MRELASWITKVKKHGLKRAPACQYRLDKYKNGFIRLRDWGACDSSLKPVIERLTTQYMRKHLALPSPMLSSPEVMDEYGQRIRAQEVSTLRQVQYHVCYFAFHLLQHNYPTSFSACEMKARHSAHLRNFLQVKCLAANFAFQHGCQAKITGENPIAAALVFVDEDCSGCLGR